MKHISKISVASTVIAGTGKKISTVFGRVPGGEEAVEKAFNASSSSRRQVTKRTDHPRGFIFEEDFVPRSRLKTVKSVTVTGRSTCHLNDQEVF